MYNTKGENLTGDKNIEIISQKLKEIYLDRIIIFLLQTTRKRYFKNKLYS